MFKTLACLSLVATLGFTADLPKPLKLEGTYTIVSGEHGGKAIPEDHFKGSLTVFTAENVVGTDKDKKQLFAASYTLDPKTPGKILMKATPPADAPKAPAPGTLDSHGMVDMPDADTIRLVYALPGGEAPTEFKTKANQNMFVLKRVKMEEKK